MNYPGIILHPPDPTSAVPWAPETLMDIEQLKEVVSLPELFRKETKYGQSPNPYEVDVFPNYHWTGESFGGRISFVKERMSQLFLRVPGVSFAVDALGLVLVYQKEVTK